MISDPGGAGEEASCRRRTSPSTSIYHGDAVGTPLQPIPSLRLKALRDGFEDYEYLWLLASGRRSLGN